MRGEAKGEKVDEDDSHIDNDVDADRSSSFFPLSSICICVGADADVGQRIVEAANVDALHLCQCHLASTLASTQMQGDAE